MKLAHAARPVVGLASVALLAACGLGESSSPSPSGTLEQVPEVAATLQPSVVTVLTAGGNGSGVVYKADGLILTNEHVVRGQQAVQIAFADGQRVAGTVRAADPITDLALVQVERKNLSPARFQTALPTVGSLAVVIGSPLGFHNTVTAGVISGLHREIPGTFGQSQALVDLIQTDAPISPGNSGGAVANAAGEVVGITEAYIPPQVGAVAIGFAIPSATALDVADQLLETGQVRHAFAGLEPAGAAGASGTIVNGVVPGGPAERAGLRPGDVITAIASDLIATPEDFVSALRKHRPGDTVMFKVHSPGQPVRDVRLTLVDRPASSG